MRGAWGPLVALAAVIVFGRFGQDLIWRLWCSTKAARDDRRRGHRDHPRYKRVTSHHLTRQHLPYDCRPALRKHRL